MSLAHGSTQPPSVGEAPPRQVAVIDIGATSIRMAIADIFPNGRIHIIDSVSQAVSLGKDTFTQTRIRRATIEECVRVLKSYRNMIREVGISQTDSMRVVATSAVREASNRLAFIDRVYIATGLIVEPLDEAEVNRITYMGVQPLLQSNPDMTNKQVVVAEIGSGSTEILMVNEGNVLFAKTYRLGSLRLLQMLEKFDAPRVNFQSLMESHIQRFVEQIVEDLEVKLPVELVGIGGDVRFAAIQLLEGWDSDSLGSIPVKTLNKFTKHMLRSSEDAIAQKYGLSFQDAETVGPALLCYQMLANRLQCSTIGIADTNLRDGLLNELALRDAWTAEFRNQIIRSAINLGRKFDFDEAHAKHVANMSNRLFMALQGEHQLEQRMELILYLAALLHEVGLYINVRSNHKHAMYIINNSEVFGLSRKDLLLVSLVARYHRRSSPQPNHEGFARLERNDRIVVSKLASMLRVAIALDESRSQRITHVDCSVDRSRLVITTRDVEDISLEQLTLRQTTALFEETFGLGVLLRTDRR